jgi:hypothetical protein
MLARGAQIFPDEAEKITKYSEREASLRASDRFP